MNFNAHTWDAPSRIGGIFSAGRADQIVARLNQRHLLRVVVLGASVAINGGCISQLGSDCMRFDGARRSHLTWRNESAPHKGFLVRWFGWINTTWPNAQHTLFNNAVPATTISAWIPCPVFVLAAPVRPGCARARLDGSLAGSKSNRAARAPAHIRRSAAGIAIPDGAFLV
jgi:hypothetical protein